MGLKRIDFDKASKAQMSRVLDLIQSLFPKESLPQLLFGFLQNDSFRKAFDHSADRLPPELSEIFVPIRTLFASIIEGELPRDKAVLRQGLSLYWGSSHHALKEAPESTKRRLFELETALSEDPAETDRALQIVLSSIRVNERLYNTLGMSWVRELLRRQEDKKAEEILTGLAKHHPRFELPRKWLGALRQDRMGRIAIKPQKDETATLHRGFWLDCQREVLVRTGSVDQREHFEKQARLHQSLQVPGVAPFAISGTTKEGMPYIATDFYEKPATALYQKRPPIHLVIDHLEEGIRLLWCLGKAGVSVAEFGVQWCFVDSNNRLWLQDLSQCELCPPETAFEKNAAAAQNWAADQLELIGPGRRPLFAAELLMDTQDFQEIMQWSRRLG
ncbi:MAG TPA: hypothetical protein EYN66_15295 [Myxococcales bacterium]|nr:hypothetical protein [Myxococcales bacterium]